MEQQTERQIKRQIKVQKRLKKMKKKQDKRRKKIEKRKAKRLKKLNKLKGVQASSAPEPTESPSAAAPAETGPVSQGETFDIPTEAPAVEWERQSIIPIADVERKVDDIFLKKESGIKDLWSQRYGEELELPDTPRTFELSDQKKASLEKRRDVERKQSAVAAKKADSGKKQKKEKKVKAPAVDVKPWWDLRRLIIVHGFLPDAHILLKIIVILLIDLGLWIFLLPIRILYIVFVIMIMRKGKISAT